MANPSTDPAPCHPPALPELPDSSLLLNEQQHHVFMRATLGMDETEYARHLARFDAPVQREYPRDTRPRKASPPRQRLLRTKGAIPAALRWEVWERDNFTCRHCGARRFLCADHIVPESKGGPTTLDNLQTLCKPCNDRKGNRV